MEAIYWSLLPIEWIEEKLTYLQDLLKQKTGQSAMVLRNLLGPITFEPTYPDIGKPYYVVNTGIKALTITAPLTDLASSDNGPDSYLWWTWTVRIRTVANVPIQVNLLDSFRIRVYD